MKKRACRVLFAGSLLIVFICIFAASSGSAPFPAAQQEFPELIHDPMTFGPHPEFRWHENLVAWLYALDGFMAGLPDFGWGSAVVSDVRFDARSDTAMLITRIDRNEASRFAIGYTYVESWGNNYSYHNITLGAMIGGDGSIRPLWTLGDEGYEPGLLDPGVYDIRVTLDRLSGTCTIEADIVHSYDAPLSSFLTPVWSAVESREIDEVLYIQICPYNELSAVYDVWSTLPDPGLLQLSNVRDIVIPEGDAVIVPTAARYDGVVPLVWTIGDERFSRADTAFVWETGPGDNGIYEALLSVSDGYLLDTVTVRYAVTHVYREPVVHDRMNPRYRSPFEWTELNQVFWVNTLDGYLSCADTFSWVSAVVSNLDELLAESTAWVFRVVAGGGNEYVIGLTNKPSSRRYRYLGCIALGITLRGDGALYPSFGTACSPADGTVLAAGIHDVRITVDPSVGQACFDAAPVGAWGDSLSDFSAAVWSKRVPSRLSSPAWLQISLQRTGVRVYDVWRTPVPYRPSPLLAHHAAEGRIDGIALEWSFVAPPEGEACDVLRSTDVAGRYETLARLPLGGGVTRYEWFDQEPRPGATFTYRIYLDVGADGMELLFDTGPVTVPMFPAALYQNYPNPFNPSTTIRWYLPENARARIEIYNVAGRIVRRLLDARCIAGISTVAWDGRDDAGREATSGVYFYRIVSGEFEQARKMVLLR